MGSFQVLHTRADPLSPKEERVIQSWWSKSSNDYSPLAGLLLKSDLWPYVGLIIAPPAIPYLSVLSTPEKMSINSVLRAAVGIHQFCPPSYCGNPLLRALPHLIPQELYLVWQQQNKSLFELFFNLCIVHNHF